MPFGKNANENKITSTVIAKINDAFDAFLYRTKTHLGEVFVVYPVYPVRANPHFVSESQFDWQQLYEFENNGFTMGLFKLTKRLKGELMIVDRSHQKFPVVKEDPIEAEFHKTQGDKRSVSLKLKEKNEAVRIVRRNAYLTKLKETAELKKAESIKRKEQRREAKSLRYRSQLEKAGISADEVDLLQRRIAKKIEEKEKVREKASKKPPIPRW